MFIPVYDDNVLRSIRWQYVTFGLILLNVLVFAGQSAGMDQRIVASFGIVPAELFSVRIFGGAARGVNDALAVPEGYTLLSYMFFHGDFWHITGNMLFLWVFGDNIEDALGHVKFTLFYLVCAVLSALVFFAFAGSNGGWLIGASGAVAGVMGAYIVLYPHARVFVLFQIVIPIPLPVPALWMLGFWAAMQVFYLVIGDTSPVAWTAHIGGLIIGALLCIPLKRRDVALFGGR